MQRSTSSFEKIETISIGDRISFFFTTNKVNFIQRLFFCRWFPHLKFTEDNPRVASSTDTCLVVAQEKNVMFPGVCAMKLLHLLKMKKYMRNVNKCILF